MGFKQKLLKSIEFQVLPLSDLWSNFHDIYALVLRFLIAHLWVTESEGQVVSSGLWRYSRIFIYKKTYLECLAVISDIFSGGAVFVPHQMIAVEKLCFGTSNKSERKSSHLMIVMPLYKLHAYNTYTSVICLSNKTGLSNVSMRLPYVNRDLFCCAHLQLYFLNTEGGCNSLYRN